MIAVLKYVNGTFIQDGRIVFCGIAEHGGKVLKTKNCIFSDHKKVYVEVGNYKTLNDMLGYMNSRTVCEVVILKTYCKDKQNKRGGQ